jgi:uncharacterized protein (TIGR00106 family)
MRIVAELSLEPIGSGSSMKTEISEAVKILRQCGLKHEVHALSTTVEGEWEDVVGCVRRCHERLLQMGVPRVLSTLKIETRSDKPASMERQKHVA